MVSLKKMKTTNLLKALKNLKTVKSFSLRSFYNSSNRINNVGEALEYFVKDVFCDSLNISSVAGKDKEYSLYLSYRGNANNPPDFIVKGGDAVEVKKIGNSSSGLALNTSYPKDKLYADSPLITKDCRECEDWSKKDIIYAVGVIKNSVLELLWFVYGDCYAADKEIYEKLRQKVINSINSTEDLELSETNELGHVNKVDPLGITYFRMRGMWGIENPTKVFDYLDVKKDKKPSIVALMKEEKYNSFPDEDRESLEKMKLVRSVEIKNPNNPAQFLKAKVIEL